MEARIFILNLVTKFGGDWQKIYGIIKDKISIDYKEEMEIPYTGKFVSIMDEDYPTQFRRMSKPPFGFFYEGNLSLLTDNNYKLSVICDNPEIEGTDELFQGLDPEVTIIMNEETIEERLDVIKNHKIVLCLQRPFNRTNGDIIQEIVKNGGLVITDYPDNMTIVNQTVSRIGLSAIKCGNYTLCIDSSMPRSDIYINEVCEECETIGVIPFGYSTHHPNNHLFNEGGDCIYAPAYLNSMIHSSNKNN